MHSLGIDIQDDRLVLAYCKGAGKKAKLASWFVYPLEKGKPIAERLDAARELASGFIEENGISGVAVYVGIPAGLSISRDIGFPLAVKENLSATLKYEMEKYIPVPAGDLYFDHFVLSEDGAANRMNTLLVAAKRKELEPYIGFANSLESGVFGIEPDSTALANFLAHRLGADCPPPSDLLKSAANREIETAVEDLPSPELAAAFGLGLKGLGNAVIQINLLPDEFRKKPGRAGYYLMIFLAALALLTGIAWGGSHLVRQRMVLRELQARNENFSTEIKKYDNTLESIDDLGKRIDYLNSLRLEHTPLLDILRELARLIPDSAWVRNFVLAKDDIRLTGSAESASELIPLLEDSPLFQDVKFLSPITRGPDGKEKFKIGLKLE